MPELERVLAQLEIDWPQTPAFELRARLDARGRRTRRPLVIAVAAALVIAVACALAVPQSRGAILRFLHVGGETIERVQTLPPAQVRPLRESLGFRIAAADATTLLGRPFAVRGVALYRADRVVSSLLPGNVLLSELLTGDDPILLKKLAAGGTDVEGVPVAAGVPGIWIHGGRHVFMAPQLPARFAGNTLVWQRDGITFRLEGKRLTQAAALRLARTLR
jgi:hypothetical protein